MLGVSYPRRLPTLPGPRIALPCDVPWAAMQGDTRVRSCGQCQQPVYNLSSLTTLEASELLRRDPTACIRYYQRPDGTVLTTDCPVGTRKRRRRRLAVLTATGLASVVALASAGAFSRAPIAFFTVDQLAAARRVSGPIRVEGTLVHGSVAAIPGGVRFELRSRDTTLGVRHLREVLPDNFRDVPSIELGVVVEGVLREDGTFVSSELCAKAPSGGMMLSSRGVDKP